jgi:hypothetical protein
MRRIRIQTAGAVTSVALLALLVGACGEKDEPQLEDSAQAAPAASAFPTAGGSIDQVLAKAQPTNELVVAPAGSDYTVGDNRFAFAVFKVDRTQVTDADVAVYAAHGPTGKAEGPYTGRVESLATEPAFTAQTTSSDPDAAKAVYVTDIPFDQPGEWRLVALVKQGETYSAVRMPSINVRSKTQDPVPEVGQQAPKIHTPTADEVGNISDIDTRVPPDDMHDVDFADVVGQKPAVLLFATPALCTSRVCGPVVDVAEQVKRDRPDDAAFIHQEIYNQNDPNKGLRPQLAAFNLRTEPWLFVVNSDGTISTRIEGAFSVDELNAALDKAH